MTTNTCTTPPDGHLPSVKPSSNSSVQSRLIVAFTIILALLLVVASIAIARLSQLSTSMHELVDVEAKHAHQTQQLYLYSQSSALDLLRILQSEERANRVPLYKTMDMAIRRADEALAVLQESGIDNHYLRPISDLRRDYRNLFYTTVEMLEIDSLTSAKQHFYDQTEPVLKQLLNQTMSLDNLQKQDMRGKALSLQEEIDRARMTIILIGLAALAIGLILAILIARSIAKPINQAAVLASTIAGGNYSAQLPSPKVSELKILVDSLSRMRDSILHREQRIIRLAYHDSLTGLANRTGFLDALAQISEQHAGALVVIDINRFSSINQALGHSMGDEILQRVGQRFQQSSLNYHCPARLDSDKFAFIIQNEANPTVIQANVETLINELRQPVEIHGQKLDIDVRAGIALLTDSDNDSTQLLQMADSALDHAKSHYWELAFAEPNPQSLGHEQLSLLGEMHEALAQQQFQLYYQPKTSAQDGHVRGVEALIRWLHPDKGMISPGLFIPFAEQTGFIRSLTPWVITQSLTDLAKWINEGTALVVSINISTLDLANPDLPKLVQQALADSGVPPELLCLEITESALMVEPEQALKHLQELADLGVKLAIDDYGTGQASLSYVKDLPVHELKIDRAFIAGVDQQPKQAAIVGATILMCEQLGLEVVAEGVETQAEALWLQQRHCHLLQGFGIAKPMSRAAFVNWLEEHQHSLTNSTSLQA